MRVPGFLATLVLVTIISLLYVHQEIELVKQSYKIQLSQRKLDDLLDQNWILKYNVIALKAPFKLEQRLRAEDIELVLPQRWQVVRVAGHGIMEKENRAYETSKPLLYTFLRFFTLSREAQASPR